MSAYLGEAPVVGLTTAQIAAVEAACAAAPPMLHDGLWRNIAASLELVERSAP